MVYFLIESAVFQLVLGTSLPLSSTRCCLYRYNDLTYSPFKDLDAVFYDRWKNADTRQKQNNQQDNAASPCANELSADNQNKQNKREDIPSQNEFDSKDFQV